ncbi:MAG: TaqI-like C-terminal specificity domain-containing protein, partial [Anaerolineae bacterium]
MPAPAEIVQLVELFQRNYDQYCAPSFSEAAVRHQFIDPFFAALGWDVNNTQGFAEQYKEVVHEDKVLVGDATKAPDYSFRIGKERKFFVEAKKPSVNIKHDIEPAYQLRRYAWSAKLPLSILTDFEEFSVYDCRMRPDKSDKAATGRILLLNFTDYVARWDEIAGIFSKAAVWQGALDRFAVAKAGKRGTAEVDDEFLAEIERWRELLARNLVLRNPHLRGHDVNWAVQQTIDRIVFLRICEARNLETYEQLRALLNGGHTYARLWELFRRADLRYNSGLFHFSEERGRAEAPDTLTPGLEIDDRVLKDIIEHLYYPQSPYEFSVLPADILGHVYERFLGKVIRLTPGRQVKIEEKPEVRKAGGVYYTPTYIVDYIVRQTVGPLLEGKTPAHGRSPGSLPRVADIACGSGSFLLGAYQYLLDWHLAYYLEEPERWLKGKRPALERVSGGATRLTIEERKRILMDHLYGVDIDPQAVEVTKLSLLLKVLEGEGVAGQLSLGVERVLPDLGRNIKCGNSLIGPEFYDGKLDLPDDETVGRVNAFDWKKEFPEVMTAGGFDAVIGNPPYVLLQDELRDDEVAEHYRKKYTVASYKLDTYHLFIEQGVRLARLGGYCSLITPSNFLTNNYLAPLRKFLLEFSTIRTIVVIDQPVFEGISVDNAIFVVSAGAGSASAFSLAHAVPGEGGLKFTSAQNMSVSEALAHKQVLFVGQATGASSDLWNRIRGKGRPLGELADVNFGKQLRDRSVFLQDVIQLAPGMPTPLTHRLCYTGRDVTRYRLEWSGLACLNSEIARRGGCWDSDKHQAKNKLLTRQIGTYPVFALDPMGYDCLNTMFMVNLHPSAYSAYYILGLLNSKPLAAYWLHQYYDQRRTFPKIKGTYLKELPIRTINFADPADAARHDRMVALVTQMLDLHQRLAAEGVPHAKAALQRRIEATDRQI